MVRRSNATRSDLFPGYLQPRCTGSTWQQLWSFLHTRMKEGGLFVRKSCLNKGKQEAGFYFCLLSWCDLGRVL